jgi:hypothetical protein
MQKMYDAGVKAGNGIEEERARYRALLETWEQKEVKMQQDFFKLPIRDHYLEAE